MGFIIFIGFVLVAAGGLIIITILFLFDSATTRCYHFYNLCDDYSIE